MITIIMILINLAIIMVKMKVIMKINNKIHIHHLVKIYNKMMISKINKMKKNSLLMTMIAVKKI